MKDSYLLLCIFFLVSLLPNCLFASSPTSLSGKWQLDAEKSDDLTEIIADKMNDGLLQVHRLNKRRQRPVRKAIRKLFRKKSNPRLEKAVELTKLPPEERKAKVDAIAAGFTWLLTQVGIGSSDMEIADTVEGFDIGPLGGRLFSFICDGEKRPLLPSGNEKVMAKAHINRGRKRLEFFLPKAHMKTSLFINEQGALVQELRMRRNGKRSKPTNAKFVYHRTATSLR